MKIFTIIVGAVIFLLTACSEDNKRIEDSNTEVNETTFDETVASGGRTDESMPDVINEPAASDLDTEEGPHEIVEPKFKGTDIKLYEAEGHSIYSIGKSSLFATGSTSLRSGAEQNLEKVSNAIAQRNKEGQIMIYGYIDASENPNFKTDVTQRRLQAIKDWLINQGGIDGSRITDQTIIDVGPSSPGEGNATEQEKQHRIEIIVRDTND